jgi:hypothetical protein
MTALVAFVVAVVVALLVAWSYDRAQHRRGATLRAPGDIHAEAVHSRADLSALPYEPVRQPGQKDWATYRRRDRKPGPED